MLHNNQLKVNWEDDEHAEKVRKRVLGLTKACSCKGGCSTKAVNAVRLGPLVGRGANVDTVQLQLVWYLTSLMAHSITAKVNRPATMMNLSSIMEEQK